MTTGTERTLPPMGGLAVMAANLAKKRVGYGGPTGVVSRAEVALHSRGWFPFSEEYYRIIDALAEQHHGL